MVKIKIIETTESCLEFLYKVHDDFNSEVVCFHEQLFQVLVGAENRIDFGEVGDVVTVVNLRGQQNGTQPCRSYSEVFQMR